MVRCLDIYGKFDIRFIVQVTEKALEVGADSSQFPDDWIFHSREKKPGKAFVDGWLLTCAVLFNVWPFINTF